MIDFDKTPLPLSVDDDSRSQIAELRERLEKGISGRIESITVCRPPHATDGLICVLFENKNGEVIFNELARHGIKAVTLSPCAGRDNFDASFLSRMNIPHSLAMGSVLFSLDATNTREEVDFVVERLGEIVESL